MINYILNVFLFFSFCLFFHYLDHFVLTSTPYTHSILRSMVSLLIISVVFNGFLKFVIRNELFNIVGFKKIGRNKVIKIGILMLGILVVIEIIDSFIVLGQFNLYHPSIMLISGLQAVFGFKIRSLAKQSIPLKTS